MNSSSGATSPGVASSGIVSATATATATAARSRSGPAATPGRPAGIGAILLSSLLWATTGTAATFAPEVGPLAIGAAAMGIGGLLQAVIALPALRAAAPRLREQWAIVLIGALAVAIYPLAFYSSMRYAGVAVGSVISLAAAPLASGIIERVVDRRSLGRWWMTAASLGAVGCVLLCASRAQNGEVGGGSGASATTGTVVGIALGLVAAGTYAAYSWVLHRLLRGGLSRAEATGAVFGGGGVLLVPVLLLTGGPILDSPHGLAVAAYMALVPMFVGYVLFGYGLTAVPASTATTLTLAEPAGATLLAVLIVGEHLSALGWSALALFGVVLLILCLAPDERRG